MASGDADFGV